MSKNIGKSISDKLRNVAKQKKVDFQLMIIRYLYERLLYRLSQSPYKNHLYLKGGVLLYIIGQDYARPTLDIDFMGHHVNNDPKKIENILKEICAIEDPDDGVVFDAETISSESINETKDYTGVGLTIQARLDTIKQHLKIDIGFGDVLIGSPQSLSYEPEIKDLKPFEIFAYTLETVVAEKFQAMIDLSELNSRLKDFYDIYQILTNHELDQELLVSSIQATFNNRGTIYIKDHPVFKEDFAKDAKRLVQWKAFLKKQKKELDFETVMSVIKNKLEPIFDALKSTN